MTNFWPLLIRSFFHAPERLPGSYRLSGFLRDDPFEPVVLYLGDEIAQRRVELRSIPDGASRKLTVNAGLRYQYDTTPGESHGRVANFDFAAGKLEPVGTNLFNAPKTNFAPRFGVAYSPFGNSRTVIRTGFGLFFASLNAAIAQNVPNNIFQESSTVTRQQVPDLVGFPFPMISSFGSVTNYTAFNKDYHGVYTEQ
jgi:hypothetical protein